MNVVQICKEDQQKVFELLSAVLWLGNIVFRVSEPDNHVVVVDNEGPFFYLVNHLETYSSLLPSILVSEYRSQFQHRV